MKPHKYIYARDFFKTSIENNYCSTLPNLCKLSDLLIRLITPKSCFILVEDNKVKWTDEIVQFVTYYNVHKSDIKNNIPLIIIYSEDEYIKNTENNIENDTHAGVIIIVNKTYYSFGLAVGRRTTPRSIQIISPEQGLSTEFYKTYIRNIFPFEAKYLDSILSYMNNNSNKNEIEPFIRQPNFIRDNTIGSNNDLIKIYMPNIFYRGNTTDWSTNKIKENEENCASLIKKMFPDQFKVTLFDSPDTLTSINNNNNINDFIDNIINNKTPDYTKINNNTETFDTETFMATALGGNAISIKNKIKKRNLKLTKKQLKKVKKVKK